MVESSSAGLRCFGVKFGCLHHNAVLDHPGVVRHMHTVCPCSSLVSPAIDRVRRPRWRSPRPGAPNPPPAPPAMARMATASIRLWPNIAGQHASYIVASAQGLQGRRPGRPADGRHGRQGFSEQDMKDLARVLRLPGPGTALEADPDLVELGQRIYRGGNAESGVTACIACHGAQPAEVIQPPAWPVGRRAACRLHRRGTARVPRR
jgi:cytochrome c553